MASRRIRTGDPSNAVVSPVTHKEDRLRVLAAADRDLYNLTRVSQEHSNRTFRSADQVIRFVQSRYLELGARLTWRPWLGRA